MAIAKGRGSRPACERGGERHREEQHRRGVVGDQLGQHHRRQQDPEQQPEVAEAPERLDEHVGEVGREPARLDRRAEAEAGGDHDDHVEVDGVARLGRREDPQGDDGEGREERRGQDVHQPGARHHEQRDDDQRRPRGAFSSRGGPSPVEGRDHQEVAPVEGARAEGRPGEHQQHVAGAQGDVAELLGDALAGAVDGDHRAAVAPAEARLLEGVARRAPTPGRRRPRRAGGRSPSRRPGSGAPPPTPARASPGGRGPG